MKVSIVVLNWNGKEDTVQCLKSIGKLQTSNYTVQTVVVDNASTDGSVKAIKSLKVKGLKIIRNKGNLGFAGGNNVGMQHALEDGADFVLILNNDTRVDKNLVVDLLKVAEKQPRVGVLSPKIYFTPDFEFHKERYKKSERGKVIWYAGGSLDWKNVLGHNRGVDEVDIGRYNRTEETDFATGACMLIRKEVLEDIGLFDERYFMYLEDADFSYRARQRKWKILYAPPAHIWHQVAQGSGVGSGLNDYYITRNRLLFGIQYAPVRSKLALWRESLRFLITGRKWQRQGIIDFYLGQYGKGSWK
ncbi:glycosyl transferase [Candidatus Woesebacteria bacterium]|nr:glycosyl transferase [Candidatus Woesebacteria bacterium]